MAKINLAITGCLGRMGRELIKTAVRDRSVKIVSLSVTLNGLSSIENVSSNNWKSGATFFGETLSS